MSFYRFARHLSLISGPLRLIEGEFPDQDFMLAIARWNTGQLLNLL